MIKIHHFRNATMIVEVGPHFILVDPMLGKKGSFYPFTFLRFKARRNPIVSLPEVCQRMLSKVTHCIITHRHPDHVDRTAVSYLRKHQIPIICSYKDTSHFKNKGLLIGQSIKYFEKSAFLKGTIEGIPAKHGYGFVAKPMGNVMGFFISFNSIVMINDLDKGELGIFVPNVYEIVHKITLS